MTGKFNHDKFEAEYVRPAGYASWAPSEPGTLQDQLAERAIADQAAKQHAPSNSGFSNKEFERLKRQALSERPSVSTHSEPVGVGQYDELMVGGPDGHGSTDLYCDLMAAYDRPYIDNTAHTVPERSYQDLLAERSHAITPGPKWGEQPTQPITPITPTTPSGLVPVISPPRQYSPHDAR